MQISTPTLITFTLYLIGMLIIGFAAYKVTQNLSDYILGGRRLGSIVTAISASASDMSGWLLLGLPGAMYANGLSESWIALGLIVGAYLNWTISAKRLRIYTEAANNALTLPDYLEYRFEDKSRLLRIMSAAVILLFFAFYTAAGMVAGAVLFQNSFGIDYTTALFIGAAVIVSYTFTGGFLAVSWTDLVQGLLMLLALIVAPLTLLYELNGLEHGLNMIAAQHPQKVEWLGGLTLISFISLQAWGLGYFGQPHILARFMAARDASVIPNARRISMSWMIVSLIGAIACGFFAIAFFTDKPDALIQLSENSEIVFILLTQVLFNPWIAGILLAAILAAVMSTIDSQLLVSSSAVTEDFYKVFLRRDAGEKELIWVSRIAVLTIAILACLIALDPQSKVLTLVGYAWAGFGAAFGPVIVSSLLWKKMTRNGAVAGMITGAATVIIWKQLQGGIFDLYEMLPGVILAFIAIFIFSKRGPPASKEMQNLFETVERQLKN